MLPFVSKIERKSMKEQQFIERHIKILEDELATAKKFLASVMARSQTTSPYVSLNGAKPGYGTISEDVRAAIARLGNRFTIKDIEVSLSEMSKKIDRLTIARCINRLLLAKKPEIKVVRKGKGRKAARYGKVT
jgi:hypothetical protein